MTIAANASERAARPQMAAAADFAIISGTANPDLTRAIADRLQVSPVAATAAHFPDGETSVELLEPVRGKSVFSSNLKRSNGIQFVKIRLTRKLANRIDDIDLTGRRVGDVIDLPPFDAKLLLAHGWAAPAEPRHSETADRSPRREPIGDTPLAIDVPLRDDEEPA